MTNLLYRLARQGEISWLSYYFAEFIATQSDMDMDELVCQSAALVSEANRAGDVCIDLDNRAGQPLFSSSLIDADLIPVAPGREDWQAELEQNPCVGEHSPLTLEGGRLYLNRYWHYEAAIAAWIRARAQQDDSAEPDASPPRGSGDPDQDAAVSMAARRKFCVISGGPGSGKTSTVLRILALLLERDPRMRIALTAPTGRAAALMLDSIRQGLASPDMDCSLAGLIPRDASTIHRLLGYRRHGFEHHRNNPLAKDCIVVDEASMVDLKLAYHLLDALPDHARLILLGDRDQLASVAAGYVLGDITGHGLDLGASKAPLAGSIALLRRSYRFDEDSAIGELASLVNQGNRDGVLTLLRSGRRGLRWFEDETETIDAAALASLLDTYRAIFTCATPADALDVFTSTRLLCVTNLGPLGVDALNRHISEKLQPGSHPTAAFYHGLPIMILRNQHELKLFNGDTGILWQQGDRLKACFPDNEGGIRSLALNRLPEFVPAWASTVHKSQGSEFDSVTLILPADAESRVLSRELLYTAITRARRKFILHGSSAAVENATGNLTRRHSGLAEKLGWPP